LAIDKDFYKLNWPVMMILSIGLYFILKSGDIISRSEGVALLLMVVVYLWILIRKARKDRGVVQVDEEVDESLATTCNFKIILCLVIGWVELYGGDDVLVHGGVSLALIFGVTDRVIAVAMMAVGPSRPEPAPIVNAALNKAKP